MNRSDINRITRLPRAAELAGRATDPRFYAALSVLPNPDPILRRAGKSDEVFDAIQADAHVIGELRSVRAGLLRFDHMLVPGGDDAASQRAFDLCQARLHQPPAPDTTWADLIWNIGTAPFRGFSVHELVWEKSGNEIMPARILDRPTRRFVFGTEDNELRILTRSNLYNGELAEPDLFLLNRHMPSYDNPYGVALFSSCFWPYTFKHGGFRWFVKFCERYGIPIPHGKYPAGATEAQIKALSDALENLIEAAYAATQDDESINLIETKSSGTQLPQQLLIHECNREISKALTSQTLATEINASGARAASETARGREQDVNESDRERIAYTLDQLWERITRFNVPGAKPPRSEFREESEVSKDRAEIYEIFTRVTGGASRKSMAEELGIVLADPAEPDDVIGVVTPPPATPPAQFARGSHPFPDQAAIDAVNLDGQLQGIAETMLQPVLALAREGAAPERLQAELLALFPRLDDGALENLLTRLIFLGDTWGRLSAAADSDA